MLNSDGNENGISINISNEQKKKQQQQRRQQLCTCSTLFVHFFAVALYDFNGKPSSNCPLSITLAFSTTEIAACKLS